ncbi:GNAT family N-acetyltransferase [Leisingera methylohalidivorans]|uniref:Acetyltransferase n=1 Tax=Leisingera methylohalidivorans DSM 14336 TaxID=999552 RepID=V9VPV0_9RHOB|nr:GNAT family N-acetyltransferase [Leisingera methylohalidivorans]AHC99728.1 acetyltransferase [Leisingera methylohalidivorans DSM 14336]
MTPPVLETDRLILRPHQAQDFDAVAALWAEPEVVRFISGTPATAEESWARLLRYIGHWQALGYGYWAVTLRGSGRFIGEAGFADFQRAMQPPLAGVPEAGWALAPQMHGQGIATEAVRRIHQWAEEATAWPETACIFDPSHAVSQKIARKLGYETAGESAYKGNPALVMKRSIRRE